MQELREAGIEPNILVISKLQPLRSHTGSAEGGIAASLGNVEHDDWHWHYYDTVKGGDWLVDQDAAELFAQEAPATVIELEHAGVAFSRTEDGHIAQRRFGGHTKDFGKEPVRRAAYAADRIGHQILFSLWQQCVAEGVEFAEEWYVTDLVVSEDGAKAEGVVAFDTHKGQVHAIHARNVLLATGGAGRLFHTTSNSWDLTGDGMALALHSGLQLEDSEFVQFHPTGLAHTGILLSEAARAEGGVLRNADGEAFMEKYAPGHADLAARDVVSRSITAEIDAGRGVADPKDPDGPKDCVWLDMTGIDADHMHEVLPQVVETIEKYADLDPMDIPLGDPPVPDDLPMQAAVDLNTYFAAGQTERHTAEKSGGPRALPSGHDDAGEAADLGGRDVDVVGPRQIVGVGRAQEAEAVLQHFDDALADDLHFLIGQLLEDGEKQFLLAHGRCVFDLKIFGDGQKFGWRLLLEILEFHLRHGRQFSLLGNGWPPACGDCP